MESFNNVPASSSSVADPQFVDPNTQSPSSEDTSTPTEMMEISGGRPAHTAVTINQQQIPPFPTLSPHHGHAQFNNYPGILYLTYAAALLYMFPTLIEVAQLKFQTKKQSVFETRDLFVNMAVVGYVIAIPMSVVLFCLKARTTTESFSLRYYKILRSVFYFLALLVPISLVLVLYLPPEYDFIGYAIVSTLFVVVVACSFSNYIIKLLYKKDASILEALEGNETSSHDSASTMNDD